VGLYERLPDQPKWTLDCGPHGLDDFLMTWEEDKHCFYRQAVQNDVGRRDRCDNKHHFVCQRFTCT